MSGEKTGAVEQSDEPDKVRAADGLPRPLQVIRVFYRLSGGGMSFSLRNLIRALLVVILLVVLGVGVLILDSWMNGKRTGALHAQLRVGMTVGETINILRAGGEDVWVDPACATDSDGLACAGAGINIHSPLGTVHTFSVGFRKGRVATIKDWSVW